MWYLVGHVDARQFKGGSQIRFRPSWWFRFAASPAPPHPAAPSHRGDATVGIAHGGVDAPGGARLYAAAPAADTTATAFKPGPGRARTLG